MIGLVGYYDIDPIADKMWYYFHASWSKHYDFQRHGCVCSRLQLLQHDGKDAGLPGL